MFAKFKKYIFCISPPFPPEKEDLTARLKEEDSTGKSQVPLSNGSVEHSVSSLMNGTHSSLNSDCVEDELACTLDPPELPCDAGGPLSGKGPGVALCSVCSWCCS